MTGRFFSYQIFWKEYRQMRGFWLGVFGLTLMLQVILCFTIPASDSSPPLYGLAISFPILYALGCGATAFALEHENGTYDFLRALPTRSLQTFVSKIAFTVVSAPLLVIALSASAAILALRMDPLASFVPTATVLIQAVGSALLLWAVGSTLLFVWAAFFSLLMRHAVKAALLGGCAAALSMLLAASLLETVAGVRGDTSPWVAFGIVIAVLSVVDVGLGARWYCEPSTGRIDRNRKGRRDELAETDARVLEATPAGISRFGHLVWLQWRQSKGMLFILSMIFAAALLGLIWHGGVAEPVRRSLPRGTLRWFLDLTSGCSALAIYVGMTIIPLAGANVFAGDQRQQQFRFLADRGTSPRSVWWSRHPVWIAAVLIWTAVACVPLAFVLVPWIARGPSDAYYFLRFFGLAAVFSIPIAYCFGQFCSMLIRSGVLCGTVAIVGSFLLAWWTFAMLVLHVPLFWSVLPIPIVLLVATRVRTRGWMLESNSLKTWLPAAMVTVLPAAAILAGVCLYRAYSVPLVDPGFDVAAFTAAPSPEAKETAEMYRRAYDLTAGEASGAEQQEAVDLIVKASQRAECDALSKYFLPTRSGEATEKLAEAVRQQGSRLQEQGDLDGAAERYLATLRMANHVYLDPAIMLMGAYVEQRVLADLVNWTTQPGQTRDRILAATRELEKLSERRVPFDKAVKAYYVEMTEVVDGDVDEMYERLGTEAGTGPVIYWMPWERQRARRTLRLLTSTELQTYQQVQTALALGRQVPQDVLQRIRSTAKRDDVPQRLRMSPDSWLYSRDFRWAADQLITIELLRRSTRIQMALAAWQIEHKALPKELAELTGEYLSEVPRDPYSGKPFRYIPNGVPEPIESYHQAVGVKTLVLESGKPFFWSPGPNMVSDGRLGPSIQTETVWAAGRVFPIPHPR